MRLKSGISGLDELIEGGFPDPSIVLIYGPPGAGKSIFSLQFLMFGAKEGEHGLYITTLSEKFNWMLPFMSKFRFFEREHFENGMITYMDVGSEVKDEDAELLSKMKEMIVKVMPSRIVIDPINPLKAYMSNYREFLFDLVDMLKNWGGTAIITSEIGNGYEDEMYMADGIVELIMKHEGDVIRRYVRVLKMRGTNHSLSLHPLSIDERGMAVLKANY